MSRRRVMRSFRKEVLILQAEQHRQRLQNEMQSMHGLGPTSSEQGKESPPWLDVLGSVLGAALPPRWGRWLNVGMSAWRISRRVSALRKAGL